ncbi:MAG: CBS domain-containing protein [Desulfurellaceae bacterium]|nr:CBS domain-containing protein [Desulfurellaceae bacterium]
MAAQTTYPQQVKEVMTRDVVALRPQQPFAQALALLAQHRFRHLLVIDADARLAGVISDRDLLRCMSRESDLEGVTVADIMWSAVVTVRPDTSLSEAAAQMLGRRINCLPVVENDRVCGILTSTDLLQAFQTIQTHIEQEAVPEAPQE